MSNGNQWNKRHLAADEADQKFEGRDYTRLYRVSEGNVTPKTSRIGVQCLTLAAVATYEMTTGHVLPYNLGALSGYPHFGVFVDPGHEVLEENARFAGWLKRAAISTSCQSLRRLISKTTSVRGEGSPRTSLHIREAAKRFYSPETANRRLVAVRNRANQILLPYGICVSNDALAMELHCRKPVGKSAHRAATMTLAGLLQRRFGVSVSTKGADRTAFFVGRGIGYALSESAIVRRWAVSRVQDGEFVSIRDALVVKDRLVADSTDGVEMMIDPATSITKLGITVITGFQVDHDGRNETAKMVYLVVSGSRSYHVSHTSPDRWSNEVCTSTQQAIRRAVEAWRKQDEAKAEFELPLNQTVLVWFEDSLSVGNCEPGTRAFMSRVGIAADRRFVPVDKLMPFIGEELVKRVVARAIAAAKGQLTMTAQ